MGRRVVSTARHSAACFDAVCQSWVSLMRLASGNGAHLGSTFGLQMKGYCCSSLHVSNGSKANCVGVQASSDTLFPGIWRLSMFVFWLRPLHSWRVECSIPSGGVTAWAYCHSWLQVLGWLAVTLHNTPDCFLTEAQLVGGRVAMLGSIAAIVQCFAVWCLWQGIWGSQLTSVQAGEQ
jgi:hypothetical protein